jgi:hypothetical protein
MRHCGEVLLDDCPELREPFPHLRAHGALTIRGCPNLEGVRRDQRRGGWTIGAPGLPYVNGHVSTKEGSE